MDSPITALFAIVIIFAVLCFVGSAMAPLFQNHISCKMSEWYDLEEMKDCQCPYCGGTPRIDRDGSPLCRCPDFMAANDLNQCFKHKIVYYGSSCPVCTGRVNWVD